MVASVIFEERLVIPLGIRSLSDFRQWALSDEFPETGRIDYIDGDIEVEMSPEDLFSHGTLKSKLCSVLLPRVEELELGHLFVDSTRVSNAEAAFSVEPDLVLISQAAIDDGRVRLVPKVTSEPDRFVEIEGSPDLIVEIVSDKSVRKDTKRLLAAYFNAGVTEYWLFDARGDRLLFQIHRRGASAYEESDVDANGYHASSVLACRYRLERTRGTGGFWQYRLQTRDS